MIPSDQMRIYSFSFSPLDVKGSAGRHPPFDSWVQIRQILNFDLWFCVSPLFDCGSFLRNNFCDEITPLWGKLLGLSWTSSGRRLVGSFILPELLNLLTEFFGLFKFLFFLFSQVDCDLGHPVFPISIHVSVRFQLLQLENWSLFCMLLHSVPEVDCYLLGLGRKLLLLCFFVEMGSLFAIEHCWHFFFLFCIAGQLPDHRRLNS